MPISDIGQIAKSAIETGLALVKKTGEITPERAQTLFYALESDLDEARQIESVTSTSSALNWESLGDAATIEVNGTQMTMEDLVEAWKTLHEAVTKKMGTRTHTAGDFLVVEDSQKPTSWHLPVKVNGEPNHRLMGAAWAALHGGYRGSKYAGPDKASAITKLKALYESEGMETPVGEVGLDFSEAMTLDTVTGVLQFLLDQFGDQVEEEPELPEQPEEPEEMAEAELAESASLTEVSMGQAISFVEAETPGQPSYIDFVPVSPGWGNEQDNHYYPLNVLREYAHVWQGAKMWATDHRQRDKNAVNQISEVIKSPIAFTDGGVPIARAVILSSVFEDVVRRRAAEGILHTLDCSILAGGMSEKKKYTKGGRTGKRIISISEENANVDWVTRAGAGGHALNLAENLSGGEIMTEQEGAPPEQEERVEEQEVTEVLLSENAIQTVLGESGLPDLAKQKLAGGEYETKEKLEEAITAEVDYLKAVTGSGKPFGQGASRPPKTRISEADLQKSLNEIDMRYGLREVSNA